MDRDEAAGRTETAGGTHTPRERAIAARRAFLFHLRPVRLSRRAARWTHTFGLGGSALVLWVTLAFTGILMLLVYQPVPDVAYDSVRTLDADIRFGPLVRGVHYWSANLLVAVVLLHLARVFLTGGYHRPRQWNWLIGALLLAGVLASAFTGYLLPWDQRAFWAVTISTGMLAYVPLAGDLLQAIVRRGTEIGADTLLTFYTYHTTVLPVLAIGAMAFHFWRVRKAGGVIEPPPDEEEPPGEEKVLFLPELLLREASQALVVLAVVVLLGAVVGAPIGERANPGASPNPAKAPWYFLGFQEMLIHLHPAFAVLIVPLAAATVFLCLPWIGEDGGPAGRWFLSSKARRAAGLAALLGVTTSVAGVLVDELLAAGAGGWVLRGVIPTLALAGIAGLATLDLRRRFGLGRDESIQSLVLFLTAAFATLTLVGVFFRGEGMALSLPWGG